MNQRGNEHMDHEAFVERLSEHLDGLLDGDEARAVERHLEGCEECRLILADLERIRDAAGRFRDRPPRRDLWPGIRAAIGGADVLPIGTAPRGGGRGRGRRGLLLSPPQIAAAAMVLVSLGAVGAWGLGLVATAGGPGQAEGTFAEAGEPAPTSAPVTDGLSRVGDDVAGEIGSGYADEVERLERLLASSRDRLAPGTARVLEKNLAIIDGAIRESLEALESDPNNPWVRDHLRRSWERKLDYLRDAAALVEWSATD